MQVIYHGHSCVEVQMEEYSILVDPWIVDNPRAVVTIDDLLKKNISHIILTSSDPTHRGDVMTFLEHTMCTVVTTKAIAQKLMESALFEERLVVTDYYDRAGWSVQFYPLYDSLEGPQSNNHYESILLTFWNLRIYHAGAMNNSNQIFKDWWALDLAFVPIGWDNVMDVAQAVQAIWRLHAKVVVPCYYNTWSRLKADDIEFARQVMLAQYAVPKVLRPGQYIVL